MDKSRQYIQMCKRSKEIQVLWQPKVGDFYADSDQTIRCWIPGASPFQAIRNGFAIEPGDKVTRISPLIWLPKLDQLIEMSQVRSAGFRDMSFVFYEWVKQPYGQNNRPANRVFISLEQLWLAFIMNRKHLKHWMDDNWQPSSLYS